jgi:mRNA-degrading endonuclease toxin of MazEF toxin-antitoxin module
MPTTTSNPSDAPAYCQWEIWQVDWEHEDGTSKPRPALILSSTRSANSSPEIWVAKFTKTRSEVPFRIEFNRNDPSFKETGLTETCYLYLAEARRVSKGRFIRRRGKLPILSAVMVGFMLKKAIRFEMP